MKFDKNTILFNAGGGLAILIVGIYFVRTTLWEALIMLAMLAFGFGLMARSLRSQPAKK